MKIDYLFIDLDGVVADFDAARLHRHPDDFKHTPHCYTYLPTYPSVFTGIEWAKTLVGEDKIWFATKPPKRSPYAYSEKAAWVNQHFGEWGLHRLVITQDKSLLGTEFSVIIDDRPHKGNLPAFRGAIITFGTGSDKSLHWDDAITELRKILST